MKDQKVWQSKRTESDGVFKKLIVQDPTQTLTNTKKLGIFWGK